jgi:hypothetical protein
LLKTLVFCFFQIVHVTSIVRNFIHLKSGTMCLLSIYLLYY